MGLHVLLTSPDTAVSDRRINRETTKQIEETTAVPAKCSRIRGQAPSGQDWSKNGLDTLRSSLLSSFLSLLKAFSFQ